MANYIKIKAADVNVANVTSDLLLGEIVSVAQGLAHRTYAQGPTAGRGRDTHHLPTPTVFWKRFCERLAWQNISEWCQSGGRKMAQRASQGAPEAVRAASKYRSDSAQINFCCSWGVDISRPQGLRGGCIWDLVLVISFIHY